ncbi:hypothetical protein KUTeg_010003 [Tegillarca granosa]|uniref:FHA domain-containing protein n=1 Tax=Tegillarca granosa TaxID=220873 RepID=A0ABQ9FAH9_TEGGR|nr:hypothetical protein KUTeg_010003 [Tegillarca granosa]
MWYLISTLNPDEKYTLLVGKEYLVGRKDCDIVISGDASVSRKHAILQVLHSEANLGGSGGGSGGGV